MKILILSTDNLYHRYFINIIRAEFEVVGVVFETYKRQDPFDRTYPYPDEEKVYNQQVWGKAGEAKTRLDGLPVFYVNRVNDPDFATIVNQLPAFDLGLVWGCGKIKPHVFQHFKKGLINVHRGLTSAYRGLDSEYWPVYHGDFERIGVTIHFIDEDLDTGAVLAQDRVKILPDSKIYHLKRDTCVLANRLTLEVLRGLRTGTLQGRKLKKKGRYYGAIPTVLLNLCVKKFERHVRKLKLLKNDALV